MDVVEVALLLALDASCVRIASLKPEIRQGTKTGSWKAKALGSFSAYSVAATLQWCHCGELVSWKILLLISSLKELEERNQHILNYNTYFVQGTMLDALP